MEKSGFPPGSLDIVYVVINALRHIVPSLKIDVGSDFGFEIVSDMGLEYI